MGILLLLVIVALVVYFMSGAEPTPEGQVGTLPTGGNTSGEQGGASGGTNTGSSNPESSPESRLFLISSEPAVGGTLVPGEERVKYFKRSTGHLFKNSFDGKTEERVSNITIPAIMQALWSPKKDYAVLSYYTDGMLKNFYSHYESTSSVESGFLSQDLTSMTFSPAEARVAYNVPANGLYSIITASPTNTNQKNVFTSSIPDFEISWPEKNTLSLQTRGSAFAPSYLYTLPAGGGALKKVLEEKLGLSILWNATGTDVLYSETQQDGKVLSLHTLSRASNTIRNLTFATLPEKCVWSKKQKDVLFCGVPTNLSGNLPDDWWQGQVSFNDALWKFNLETGEKKEILSVYQLDAINLFLSEDEKVLFFSNKKDGLFWSLKVE